MSSTPSFLTRALGAGVFALVAAGSSQSASARPSTGNARSRAACRAPQLTARLGRTDAALGHRFATLQLANRSSDACRVSGYPGLRFVGAHGAPLPTVVVHEPGFHPRALILRPGGRAATVIEWSAIVFRRSDERGSCRTPPRMLEITPPGDSLHLFLRWNGGVVCQHGEVLVRPLTQSK